MAVGCLDAKRCKGVSLSSLVSKGVAALFMAPFGLECEGVAGLGAAPSGLAQEDVNNPWVSWAFTEFFCTEPLNVMRLR